jgi:hypothetical protein
MNVISKNVIRLIFSFLLLLIASSFAYFYANSNQNEITSYHVGNIQPELRIVPFPTAVKNVDLIAKIEIIEKIAEINEPSEKTIYKAKILKTIKPDPNMTSNTIHVMQQGNSKWTFDGNDFFGPGEQYVILFNVTVQQYPNTYWIEGEQAGIFEVEHNGYLRKWSYADESLKNIEDVQQIQKFKDNNKSYTRDVQIFSENDFIANVKMIVK